MKLITMVRVLDADGWLVAETLTRTALEKVVGVPIHSRNESGKWNVEDPDAEDSLSGIDEVSITLRTKFQIHMKLVRAAAPNPA